MVLLEIRVVGQETRSRDLKLGYPNEIGRYHMYVHIDLYFIYMYMIVFR